MENKAIFFDRDGCLIIDKHYMHDPKELEYYPDTFSACKSLQDAGYQIFIVTNQSGIGRGMFTQEQMQSVHDQMIQDFKNNGIELKDIAFCPHTPDDNCSCRKPHPKMINDLSSKHQISKTSSYMIGDKISDAQCGENAGTKGCLLRIQSDQYPHFNSLQEFATYVLKEH
jgi:D-glycero-D-manno-heptose 1,7-bisphosphate phosphatase